MGDLVAMFGLLCCGGLMLLIFTGGGAFAIYQSRKSIRQAGASQGWQSVTGILTETQVSYTSNLDTDGDSSDSYTPQVSYQYQVGGQTFTGKRITFGFTKAHNSRRAAENELARYPLNSQVTVFYNPVNPAEAVLERKAGGSSLALILGVIFILLGLCISCPLIFSGLAAAWSLLTSQ